MNELINLFLTFAKLGLLAFGGLQVVLGEFQREVVDVHGWLTNSEFLEVYALGQLSPGPNMLFSILIGFKVAGLPGAIAAGLGMFVPTTVLIIVAASFWHRLSDNYWVQAIQRGLVPVALGLMFAAAYTIGRIGIHDARGLIIAGAGVALILSKRVSPFVIILLAALVGLVLPWDA